MFVVNGVVAQNSQYTLHACQLDDREVLAQVPNGVENEDAIIRNAFILDKLAKAAVDVEAEFSALGKGSLSYDLGFPELVSTVTIDGDMLGLDYDTKANLIGFRNVPKLSSMIPLLKVWKNSTRIDLRTSAWMMGKLLKVLSFAHDQKVRVADITGNNILFEPDQHYVLVFNWSRAVVGSITSSVRREEIKLAAQCVIKALGGDLERAMVNDADRPYVNYLQLLATNGESTANKAHANFYAVVDDLCKNPDSVWKTGFYEFTTFKL